MKTALAEQHIFVAFCPVLSWLYLFLQQLQLAHV